MGKIKLEAMEFYAFHGVFEAEKKNGNRFEVSVEIDYDFEDSVMNDDLKQTIDYSDLYTLTKEVMEIPVNLLESLALKIANGIKMQFPSVNEAVVEVSKFDPPIGGKCAFASVKVNV